MLGIGGGVIFIPSLYFLLPYTGIEQSLIPTNEMIKKADEYRKELFYNLDGNAAERFKNKMEELYYDGSHVNIPVTD